MIIFVLIDNKIYEIKNFFNINIVINGIYLVFSTMISEIPADIKGRETKLIFKLSK